MKHAELPAVRRAGMPATLPAQPTAHRCLAACLAGLCALAWLASARLSTPEMRIGLLTGGIPHIMGTMGAMGHGSMPLGPFMASWVVMMLAMMLPAISPVILAFDRDVPPPVCLWLASAMFVAGYVLLWSVPGLVAYALATGLNAWTVGDAQAVRCGAILVMVGGVYQLTPFKQRCILHGRALRRSAHYRHPAQPLRPGSFQLGLRHGGHCLGSCWALMLILILLGMMNLVWMGTIALISLAERLLADGMIVSWVVGLVFIAVGSMLLVAPIALPA